jgi:hypothetical protein
MLDEEIIERIIGTCHETNCRIFYAFSTSNVDSVIGFEFPATVEGFETFQDETALSPYLVIPEHGSFAVLSEGSYYSLVAGPPPLVRRFLGGDPSRWIEEFKRYIWTGLRSRSCEDYLKRALKRCLEVQCTGVKGHPDSRG